MMTDFHSEDRIPWHPRKAQRAISELLANESYGIFWLIEVDGPSIGFLVLTLGFSLEFHGRTAFVDEFYMLESTGSTNMKASRTGAFTFCRSGFASAHRMRSSRFRSRETGVCNTTR